MVTRRLLLFGLLLLSVVMLSGNAYAWLSGWQYRRPITIDNSGSTELTDFQVKITVDTASLISEGKMNSDCSDMRFTDDSDTELPYWIEGPCNDSQTVVWVKVPSIPTSGTTIYMYYGNSSATDASDGDAVFEFFDDFEGTSLDTSKWETFGVGTYGDIYVQNGELVIDHTATTYGSKLGIRSLVSFDYPIAIEFEVMDTSVANDSGVVVGIENISTSELSRISTRHYNNYVQLDNAVNITTLVANQYYRLTYAYDGDNSYAWYGGNSYSHTITVTAPYNVVAWVNGNDAHQGHIPFIAVRKYADPEPTASVGAEETPSVGVSVSLSHSPTAQSDLALDPEANITSVTVEYNAVFSKQNVTVTYYRAFDGDSNTTILEGTDDANYITFSRTYNSIGDYNICVYVRAVDDSNNEYEDTACDVVHIDQYPQALGFDWNNHIPFPSETLEFTGQATDNRTIPYSWDFGDGNTDSGQTVQHAYSSAGTYTVTMTVTDDVGLSKSVSKSVAVYDVPEIWVIRTDDLTEYSIATDPRLTVVSATWSLDNNTTLTGNPAQYDADTVETTVGGTVEYTVADDQNNTRALNDNIPIANLSYTVTKGFLTDTSDTVDYTTTFHDGTPTCELWGNDANITDTNTIIWRDGDNNIYITCDTTTEHVRVTDTLTLVVKHLLFIDEGTGNAANLNDVNTAKIVDIDNGYNYDLKANSKTDIYYVNDAHAILQLQETVPDITDLVIRELDTRYLNAEEKVCLDTVTQYQIILSSSVKPVVVRNAFAQCSVLASTTSYAYQTGMSAKAYTQDYVYYLYTIEDGKLVFLASIDGAIPNTINLDTLKYTTSTITIAITTHDVGIDKIDDHTVRVYYRNLESDNERVTVTVKDKTGKVWFTHTETTNPNEFTLYFNDADINVSGLLTLEIVAEREGGEVDTIKRLFTMDGQIGTLEPSVAIAVAVFILLLGFTLFLSRYTFAAFGVIISLIAIAILAQAPQTASVLFTEVLAAIILLYSIIAYRAEGSVIT